MQRICGQPSPSEKCYSVGDAYEVVMPNGARCKLRGLHKPMRAAFFAEYSIRAVRAEHKSEAAAAPRAVGDGRALGSAMDKELSSLFAGFQLGHHDSMEAVVADPEAHGLTMQRSRTVANYLFVQGLQPVAAQVVVSNHSYRIGTALDLVCEPVTQYRRWAANGKQGTGAEEGKQPVLVLIELKNIQRWYLQLSTRNMHWPYRGLPNDALSQARLQLALSARLLIKTYPGIRAVKSRKVLGVELQQRVLVCDQEGLMPFPQLAELEGKGARGTLNDAMSRLRPRGAANAGRGRAPKRKGAKSGGSRVKRRAK